MKNAIWMLALAASAAAVAVADEDDALYPESPAPAKDLGTELLQDETTFEENPYYSRDRDNGRPPFVPGRQEPPSSFRKELNEDPRRSEPLFNTRQPSLTSSSSSSPSSFEAGNRFRSSKPQIGSSGTRPQRFRGDGDDFARPFGDGPLDRNQQRRPQFNRFASRASQDSRGSSSFRGSQRYTSRPRQSQRDREDSQSGSQLGAKYEYSYDINSDVTGDDKSHKEERDGNKVIGEYRVREADGTLRVVKYTADRQSGFRATVNYEPGQGNEEKTKVDTRRLQPSNRGRERVKVFREDAPRQKNNDDAYRRGQEDRYSSRPRSPAAGTFRTESQRPEFDRRPSRPLPQYKEDSRQAGSPQFQRGLLRDNSFRPRADPQFRPQQQESSQSSPFSTRSGQQTDKNFARQNTRNENTRPITQLRGSPSVGRDEKHQQDFMGDVQDFRSRSQSQSGPKSGFRAQHGPDHLRGSGASPDSKTGFSAQHGSDHFHGSREPADRKSGFRTQPRPDHLQGSRELANSQSELRAQSGADHLHSSGGSVDLKSGFRGQQRPDHLQGSRGLADSKSELRAQSGADHLHSSRGSVDLKSGFRAQHGPDHLQSSRDFADSKSELRAQSGADQLHSSRGSVDLKSGFRAQHEQDHLQGSRELADSASEFRAQHGADHLQGSRGSPPPLREIQVQEGRNTQVSQGFRSKTLRPLDQESQLRPSGRPQESRIPNPQPANEENASYQRGRPQDFRNQNIRPVSEENVPRLREVSQSFGNQNAQPQGGSSAFRQEESPGFRAQTVRPVADPDSSLPAGAQGFRPLSPQPISDNSPRLQGGSPGSRGSNNAVNVQGSGSQQNLQQERPRHQQQHRFDASPRSQQNSNIGSERRHEFQQSNLREDLNAAGFAARAGPTDQSGRAVGRPSVSSQQGVEANIDESLLRSDERVASQQYRERSQSLNQGHHHNEEHHIDAARSSHRGAEYEELSNLPQQRQFTSQGEESARNPERFPSSNSPSSDPQFRQNTQGSQSFRVGPPHPSFVGNERPSRTSVVLEGSRNRFRQDPDQRDQSIVADPSDAPRTTFQGAGGREGLGLGAVSNFPDPLNREYRQSNTEEEFLDH